MVYLSSIQLVPYKGGMESEPPLTLTADQSIGMVEYQMQSPFLSKKVIKVPFQQKLFVLSLSFCECITDQQTSESLLQRYCNGNTNVLSFHSLCQETLIDIQSSKSPVQIN